MTKKDKTSLNREKELEQIVEAVLFATPQVVSLKELSALIDAEGTTHIRTLIESLNQQYSDSGRVFRIQEVGGGVQMRTETKYRPWIQKLEPVKPIKLSLPTIETLAIVAYKQPITRASIEFIRGVDSSYTLRTLLQKKLIRIVGKEAVPGRPILYGTSKTFLEIFGLKNISNLPSLSELDMVKDEDAPKKIAANNLPEQLELPELTED
ncbi:MAG: SMC-Scp complex subunit ScpB [SAR324 cluster bacterium]|nr:SMC-Scp complex subunit ScpB [SAR324 cluster bacterium]